MRHTTVAGYTAFLQRDVGASADEKTTLPATSASFLVCGLLPESVISAAILLEGSLSFLLFHSCFT